MPSLQSCGLREAWSSLLERASSEDIGTEAMQPKVNENSVKAPVCSVCACKQAADTDSPNIVKLNVGGKKFLTSRETIMQHQGSMLFTMIAGPLRSTTIGDGFTFIDRDGDRFHHVLNYLRCGSLPSFGDAWRYEEIMEEADFFSLVELRELCERHIQHAREEKHKETHRSYSCRVTLLEPQQPPQQAAGDEPGYRQAAGGGVRERLAHGVFTLDEDF